MKKEKRKKIFNWKWIKDNFWNVVTVMIIWQIIVYIIFSLLVLIFPGLNVPV